MRRISTQNSGKKRNKRRGTDYRKKRDVAPSAKQQIQTFMTIIIIAATALLVLPEMLKILFPFIQLAIGGVILFLEYLKYH